MVRRSPLGVTLEERFERLISREPNSGCWLWIGSVGHSGYGKIVVGRRDRQATHISLELSGKPRPEGMWALHKCDNPGCVNPDHLFWGDQFANMADRAQKRRDPRANKQECKRGHSLGLDNVWIDSRGRRNCKTCEALRKKNYRASGEACCPLPGSE